MIKRKGHYYGTEIGEKWWKRYKKDKLFARGTGEYWHDSDSFYFKRYLTKTPIAINFRDIKEIKKGKWHAGKWAGGRQIIKLIWQKGNVILSSGFLLSKSQTDSENIMQELQNYTKTKKDD
jgi:hypothetical protein